MDSSRTEVLVATGLLIASSFGMGILGAQAAIDRIEARRAREAAAVDRELDQIQEDVDDLQRRVDGIDARLTRIEKLIDQMTVTVEEDPT